jgi:D-glycero-D-manno-heptose 1,7-bisphosphate phosphatase
MEHRRRAVFLDRDGVLIEERGLLVRPDQIRVLENAPAALARLREAGFLLVVATNQAVVARGLATESDVDRIHAEMSRLLQRGGAPALDAIYFCPHHPHADLPAYRVVCDCRKPRPGMLLEAAREHDILLDSSFMIGDRLSDVVAGARAGCRTVLLNTPGPELPPIVTAEPLDESVEPDHACAELGAAVEWILTRR